MTRYQMIQKMFPTPNECAFYEERIATITHAEVSYAFNAWKVNHNAGIAILKTAIEKAKGENRTARPIAHFERRSSC